MSKKLLSVEGAVCRINAEKTLKVDHFSISEGEHWCIFGENGSGKSLLAALLRGVLTAGSSALEYADGFSPETDILCISFEEQQQLWNLENRHDISEFSDKAMDQGTLVRELICGRVAVSEQAQVTRLNELADALQLVPLLNRGIRYLSSGQLRKTLIARALFQQPRLLILDEPLESIDRETSAAISELLIARMNNANATLLLTRKQAGITAGLTHMGLMQNLQLVVQGRVDAVRQSAQWRGIVDHVPEIADSLPAGLAAYAKTLPPAEPLIVLRNVNAAYQQLQVLRSVNWTFDTGQHALIEGPNGCGKSTLLGLITAENHKAYGQQVWLFGRRRGTGESVWDIKSRFGIVSNELHNRYVKGWNVLEVVVSGFYDSLGLYDDSGASEHACAREWLQALGLAQYQSAAYHQLSFGQQRLVLLARAMVKQPAILILDEPCVGLDDHFRELILGTLDRIAGQTSTQLIYVSHTEGEHPRCINQFLRFVPDRLQPGDPDSVSTHSRIRYRLEIR